MVKTVTLESLKAKREKLRQQEEELDAKIEAKEQALAEAEEKARGHAIEVIGSLVIKNAPDSEWKKIDWDALAEHIEQAHIDECEAEELDVDEATKRLRDWERQCKKKAKAQDIKDEHETPLDEDEPKDNDAQNDDEKAESNDEVTQESDNSSSPSQIDPVPPTRFGEGKLDLFNMRQ